MTAHSRRDDLVNLALKRQQCTQKALAKMLNVSPTQISAWKKGGAHMSDEMSGKLTELAGLAEKQSEFEAWAGSPVDEDKWTRLFGILARNADSSDESGYHCSVLIEEEEYMGLMTARMLIDLGVEAPKPFPAALEMVIDVEPEDDQDNEDQDEAIQADPVASLVWKAYRAFTDVSGFYHAFVAKHAHNPALDLDEQETMEREADLLLLAACKLDLPAYATKSREASSKVRSDFRKWLSIIKHAAISARSPLGAELMHLVTEDHDPLGHEAEAESLGFNESRLHPDIYTNEILVGMRMLHQVLPTLLDKLGVDFKLDEQGLKINL